MTYRAWEQKPLDRTAVRELTAAIAEQAAAQLEEQAMDEAPWSDEKYKAVLAAQQKENALLAGILAARGITDPAEALTLLAGEEELSDPALLTDMDAACQRIWQAIDNGETIAVFGDYDVDGVTATACCTSTSRAWAQLSSVCCPAARGTATAFLKTPSSPCTTRAVPSS